MPDTKLNTGRAYPRIGSGRVGSRVMPTFLQHGHADFQTPSRPTRGADSGHGPEPQLKVFRIQRLFLAVSGVVRNSRKHDNFGVNLSSLLFASFLFASSPPPAPYRSGGAPPVTGPSGAELQRSKFHAFQRQI